LVEIVVVAFAVVVVVAMTASVLQWVENLEVASPGGQPVFEPPEDGQAVLVKGH